MADWVFKQRAQAHSADGVQAPQQQRTLWLSSQTAQTPQHAGVTTVGGLSQATPATTVQATNRTPGGRCATMLPSPQADTTSGAIAPIQRVVRQATREKDPQKKDKWYSSYNPNRYFKTQEKAQSYEDNIRKKIDNEKTEQILKKRKVREDEYEKLIQDKYKDYKPPKSSMARMYDSKSDHKDLKLTKLNAKIAKKHFEKMIDDRRSGKFEGQVVQLGEHYFSLKKGTDIGIAPAKLRPDIKGTPKDRIPLSREGKEKPYRDIASGLDAIAQRLSTETGETLNAVRSRMGKDLDRMTRGNEPDGTYAYTNRELANMQELASILRLDKARVPGATNYIREAFANGGSTFKQLLADEVYVGAGQGGVEALRKRRRDDGDESAGSDIDDA